MEAVARDAAVDTAGDIADAADGYVEDVPPGLVRFIHISDPHYKGMPGQPLPGKMEEAISILNGLKFQPDLAFVTGDLCHFTPDEYNDPEVEGPFHLFVSLMNKLDVQWYPTVGNHDYYSNMDPVIATSDKEAREAMILAVLERPLYYSVQVNGVRFIALNSMDGEAWDANDGLIGSFADEQLAWLSAELADGRPSLLFFHHPPGTTTPMGDQDSLCDIISANPGVVKGTFTGHLHEFMKGDYCGVPSYVTETFELDKPFYYLVEYDGETDTLTLVNEHEIPFSEIPQFECEAGEEMLLVPEAAVDTFQKLKPEKMTSDAPELGKYVGEVFEAIPLVMYFEDYEAPSHTFGVRLAMASRWGEVEGYLSYLDGMPCFDFDFSLTDPCFTAGPVDFDINLLLFLPLVTEEPPELTQDLPISVRKFWLEGKMTDVDGVPVIESGILHGRLLGTKALNDMKALFVLEYCAGNMENCEPGSSEDMPECPNEDPGVKFYPQVPEQCDFSVADYSVRMILMMAESFGISDMDVIGEISSYVLETSEEPVSGKVHPGLFSTEEGKNCQ